MASSWCKLRQLISWPQTAQVNGQSLQRCFGVSGVVLHSLHNGSWDHPLFSKLFAVNIFRCSKIHAKNLHFGSPFAFQIGVMDCLPAYRSNWMRYALLVVYSPSEVYLQIISSSISGLRSSKLISSHRLAYSLNSVPVCQGNTWLIQKLLCEACCTVNFFLLDFLKRLGPNFFFAAPLIQLECQKLALFPLSTVTTVDALDKSRSLLSQGIHAEAERRICALPNCRDASTLVLSAFFLRGR